MVQVRIGGLDGEVLPAMGELDEAVWEAVSEGQPIALTRRGRGVAVLVDADSYAEMIRAAQVPEGVS